MTAEIVSVDASYRSVKARMSTASGHKFVMQVSATGLSFFSDENSAGTLAGKPIKKSPDDLLNWFGGEGISKPFRERAQVKPKSGS